MRVRMMMASKPETGTSCFLQTLYFVQEAMDAREQGLGS